MSVNGLSLELDELLVGEMLVNESYVDKLSVSEMPNNRSC
jgi:hypothetical protein